MADGTGRAPSVLRNTTSLDGSSFGFLNETFHLKVSSAETGGQLCINDTVRSAPGGPPLHVHFDQDEWFLVTEDEFQIRVVL